jgi:hypothetical protein
MDLLGQHFKEDIVGFFHHILTTSYFIFNGEFYGKTGGVVMGSTFSPVVANFYMEDCKKVANESAPSRTPLLVS